MTKGNRSQMAIAAVLVALFGWGWTKIPPVDAPYEILAVDDTPMSEDMFGAETTLSPDGGYLVTVASHDYQEGAGGITGAIYIHRRNVDETWTQVAKFRTPGDGLGSPDKTVAISRDAEVVVVGDSGSLRSGKDRDGAVTLLKKDGEEWTIDQILVSPDRDGPIFHSPPEGVRYTKRPGETFGFSVAITPDGSTLVVGAAFYDEGVVDRGVAYVFDLTGETPVSTRLDPPRPSRDGRFGLSVAIADDGRRVFIGEPGSYDDDKRVSGSISVFELAGSEWVETDPIHIHGDAGSQSGILIEVSGDGEHVVSGDQGATIENDPSFEPHSREPADRRLNGALYLFSKVEGDWRYVRRFITPISDGFEPMGGNVAISRDGSVIATGLPGAWYGGVSRAGAALVFRKAGDGWRTSMVQAPDPHPSSRLGFSVTLDEKGERLVSGAIAHRHGSGLRAGAAYVFELPRHEVEAEY